MLHFYTRANCYESEERFNSHAEAASAAQRESATRNIPCETMRDDDEHCYRVITFFDPYTSRAERTHATIQYLLDGEDA